MKVAVVLWPCSKMGGILTVHTNVVRGLQLLGHEVTDYYLSPNTTRVTPYTDDTCATLCCEGRSLGIRSRFIKETIAMLQKYDVVIYSHPAPAKNRSFQDETWKLLFERLAKQVHQIVLWHDPFWRQYYPWVEDVLCHVEVIGSIQEKAQRTLPESVLDRAFVCNHPLDLRGMGEHSSTKENLVILPHQFKSWKKIHLFIAGVPQIPKKIRVEVYSKGIERYYMAGSLAKRKSRYKKDGKWIWDEAIKAGMQYLGVVSSEQIQQAYKRQRCVVDLSVGELGTKKGISYRSINYAVLECMKYGGVPVVQFYSVLPPFEEGNFLVVDHNDIVQSTIDCTTQAVLEHGCKRLREMRAENRRVLNKHYACQNVVSSLLERI